MKGFNVILLLKSQAGSRGKNSSTQFLRVKLKDWIKAIFNLLH